MSFWRELRRRHIFRIAAAYAVTAWLLIQLAAIALPAFGAPHWVLKVVIGLFVLFFPIALILAWAFEITPEGVRRTEKAHSNGVPPSRNRQQAGRILNTAIIVILTAAVSVLAWRLIGAADSSAALPEKSIAVLPFENLSTEKSNAYFADGMQDLILTKLADIGDLKVISRTSTLQYGSHPQNLRNIAKRLGVGTILEGSVQKAGNQVLINVQLIDARNDSHLWAKSYTRTLDNIFGVEGEVAQKIANALRARLTKPERHRLAAIPTENPAAYDAYLRARALTVIDLQEAAKAYRQAVALEPDFGLAWAGLAYIEENLYEGHSGNRKQEFADASHALARARVLSPDTPETLLALGNFRMVTEQDFKGALAACTKAATQAPGNPNVIECVTSAKWALGDWQQALEQARKAMKLDPLNPDTINLAAKYFAATRNFTTALRLYDRSLALRPDGGDATAGKAETYLAQGRVKKAGALLEELDRSNSGLPPLYVNTLIWRQKFLSRDYASAIALVQPFLKRPADLNLDWQAVYWNMLGMAQQRAGQAEAGHEAFRNARADAQRLLARKNDVDPVSRADYYDLLSVAEAGLGRKGSALAAAKKAIALVPTDKNAADGPIFERQLAIIRAWVGDGDAAIATLTRLLHTPSTRGLVTLPLLKLDPFWDPLRTNPRFRALIRRQEAKQTQ